MKYYPLYFSFIGTFLDLISSLYGLGIGYVETCIIGLWFPLAQIILALSLFYFIDKIFSNNKYKWKIQFYYSLIFYSGFVHNIIIMVK